MSRRTIYTCDVCRRDIDPAWHLRSVVIKVTASSEFESDMNHEFDDVCVGCRDELRKAVWAWLERVV